MNKGNNKNIEWVGKIPDGWKVVKLKSLVDTHFGGCWGEEATGSENDRLCIRVADFDFANQRVKNTAQTYRNYTDAQIEKITLKNDDLILEKSGGGDLTPVGRIILYKKKEGDPDALFANFCECIRLKKIASASFIAYALKSLYYSYGSGYFYRQTIGIQNLNMPFYLSTNLILPNLTLQEKIVDVLRSKCVKIDELIVNEQEQIETLKLYKKSLINETVAKGINKHVKMVESDVDYMIAYPENWKILRGKNVLTLLNRPTNEDDKVITCFRDGEVTLRSNRREEGFTFADKEIGYQGIEEGDLVIHGMDGFAGAIGISDERGKGSPVLSVCSTNQNKRYIMYYLRSLAYRDVILALSTGIRVRSCDLRWNKLANLYYLIPPIEEQNKIVEFLDSRCSYIDNLITIKQEKINYITEYKKSLIYEYVTGKIQVS